jgi:hypothetical protein
MKTAIKATAGFAIGAGISYLVAAFSAWQLDPSAWSQLTRDFAAASGAGLGWALAGAFGEVL